MTEAQRGVGRYSAIQRLVVWSVIRVILIIRALFSDAQTHDVGTGRIGADGFRTTPGAVFNTSALEAGVDPYGEDYDVPIIGLDLVRSLIPRH
ncbi:MAG: hypothetical protein R3B66_11885 [Candidatus Scalinduaceae bacterium]